ncbi:MAG: universal stress protein [Acidobacteria bacterium]|nr:universal stress protein [Acidobacteriota bacterium]
MSRIVVGVDGSPGSIAALRWAHAEARLRRATLEVVGVWQYPMMTTVPAFGALPDVVDLSTQTEEHVLGVLRDNGVESTDEVPVSVSVAEGAPAQALISAATGAELLVVGSRGHGGFAGLLLGSVSHQCTMHGPCPVVVVHP